MKRGRILAVAVVVSLTVLSLQFLTTGVSSDHLDLDVKGIENISASESVAYGEGYRIESQILLSERASNPVIVRYRTQRGTAAGGPESIFDYTLLNPGDRIKTDLEKNKGSRSDQKVKLSYMVVEKELEKNLDAKVSRVFRYPENYSQYVKENSKDIEFSFEP